MRAAEGARQALVEQVALHRQVAVTAADAQKALRAQLAQMEAQRQDLAAQLQLARGEAASLKLRMGMRPGDHGASPDSPGSTDKPLPAVGASPGSGAAGALGSRQQELQDSVVRLQQQLQQSQASAAEALRQNRYPIHMVQTSAWVTGAGT